MPRNRRWQSYCLGLVQHGELSSIRTSCKSDLFLVQLSLWTPGCSGTSATPQLVFCHVESQRMWLQQNAKLWIKHWSSLLCLGKGDCLVSSSCEYASHLQSSLESCSGAPAFGHLFPPLSVVLGQLFVQPHKNKPVSEGGIFSQQ